MSIVTVKYHHITSCALRKQEHDMFICLDKICFCILDSFGCWYKIYTKHLPCLSCCCRLSSFWRAIKTSPIKIFDACKCSCIDIKDVSTREKCRQFNYHVSLDTFLQLTRWWNSWFIKARNWCKTEDACDLKTRSCTYPSYHIKST